MRAPISTLFSATVVFLALVSLAGVRDLRAQSELDGGATVDPSFAGLNMHQQKAELGQWGFPANPQLAVGPEHVIEVTRTSVAIYERDGTRVKHSLLRDFLSAGRSGVTYWAIDGATVFFHQRTGRWIAGAYTGTSGVNPAHPLIIAISRTADPTGVWDKYLTEDYVEPRVGDDFTIANNLSMGVDATGIYFSGRLTVNGQSRCKIFATPLAPLLTSNPELGPETIFDNLTGFPTAPTPAATSDATGPLWFADSVPNRNSGVRLVKLTWNGNTPALSSPLDVATPAFGPAVNAPHKDTDYHIETDVTRLAPGVQRSGRLWLSRNVGVNATGGATNPDRSGCEWMEINVAAASPTLAQSGRIFDTGIAPRFYFFPTLSVNSASDVVVSYCGSKATEYVSAYYSSRLRTDPVGTLSAIQTFKAGEAVYDPRTFMSDVTYFGRFGSVVTDPEDDLSFWSCQSYAADTPTPNSWGTWIGRIKLSGTPVLPAKAKIKPAKLAFGKVKVGKFKSRSFTITNKGETPLFGTVGPVAAPYSVAGGGAFNLKPKAKRKVTVTFTPSSRGAAPSSLTVTTNDPRNGTVTIKMTGTGG